MLRSKNSKSSQSYHDMARAILHKFSGPRSQFEDWPMEELVAQLEADGVRACRLCASADFPRPNIAL
jgi:hypothetical protein